MKPQVIGISGVAGSGKDTFLDLLSKNLPNVKRFAFADNLKKELNPFFKDMYNVDLFTCDRATKDLLRPILVCHGKMRRIASKGRHWLTLLEKEIRQYQLENPEHHVVVTDVRYDGYDNDEVSWLKNEMNGVLVHVKRYVELKDESDFPRGPITTIRKYIEAPNEDERLNDPKLQVKANFKIEWPTVTNNEGKPDFSSLNIYVEEFVKFLQR
jgi:hypothetical protein